jgi:hypothetical protein
MVARPTVERAERKEDPKIIEPFNVAHLIRNEEREINVYMRFTRKELEDKRKEGNNPDTHDHKIERCEGRRLWTRAARKKRTRRKQ